MKREKLKQLEMALTEHKPLIADLGENQKYLLEWNDTYQNYVGTSLQTNIEIGIWLIEMLLDIANGKINNCSLEVAYE